MSDSLFGGSDSPPQAVRLAPKLHALAKRGVYLGTSSWKYDGWLGSIYSPNRCVTRDKFSKKKFEDTCIREYAETFPAVGGDFSFYRFPSPETWKKVFEGTPPGFVFGLKVPEAVTVARWPTHPRYGMHAGLDNTEFLSADLFKEAFLDPLEEHKEHVGVCIFEFGTFAKKDFEKPQIFFGRLEGFLASLPRGWRYAVELRNKDYLGPEYFAALSRHNVAHVFNAWTRMPTIAEQIAMPGAFTANFSVVRALLRKGRSYEDTVKMFDLYSETRDKDIPTRNALCAIAERALKKKQRAYVFVNNRLGGNAPSTIEAVVSQLDV